MWSTNVCAGSFSNYCELCNCERVMFQKCECDSPNVGSGLPAKRDSEIFLASACNLESSQKTSPSGHGGRCGGRSSRSSCRRSFGAPVVHGNHLASHKFFGEQQQQHLRLLSAVTAQRDGGVLEEWLSPPTVLSKERTGCSHLLSVFSGRSHGWQG
ncbi:hypothetical protein AV530_003583 [Patagioenas fasciata monilis]|uniref:Uncharacterized protein n=1 Tax=Patagioenas fasciata monilis TaxID=372326 RepID=A0A1V4KZF8_PATFA|nr:hypothetical protein AV530_003583 [Patagioenas fasciata monilis]